MKNTPQSQSLKTRLANLAKAQGRALNDVAQEYVMLGVLARLQASRYMQTFILKGGMMYNVWDVTARRYTRDVDFKSALRYTEAQLTEKVREILSIPIDDALEFDVENIRFRPIMKGTGYRGASAHFAAYIGTMRIWVDIDIGVGDPVVPYAKTVTLPGMLGRPAVRVLGYSMESAIAEKLHAMVQHMSANSRMKDYFDVYVLSQHITDMSVMREALVQAFAHRQTPLPPKGYLWNVCYASEHQKQWEDLLSRSICPDIPRQFSDILDTVANFLEELLHRE